MKLKKSQAPVWTAFTEVTERPMPLPDGCTKVLKNSRWLVFFYRRADTWMGPTRLIMIRAATLTPTKGHSWQDFQRIKNELFGPHVQAVEFYPSTQDLVDQADLYWLWILEDPKPDALTEYRESLINQDLFQTWEPEDKGDQ